MRRRAGNLTREPSRLTPASPPLRTVAITINHKSRLIVYSSSLSFCLFRLVRTGKSLKHQLDECSDMFWWRHMWDGGIRFKTIGVISKEKKRCVGLPLTIRLKRMDL